MKTFTLSVIFCFITFFNLSAQWVQQSVPGTISFLTSVNFINPNSGVTTGWGLDTLTTCRAFYTTNGGTTWFPATIPDSSRAIVSTEIINSQTIYGTGGMNILSEDNNRTFENNYIMSKGKVQNISRGIEFSYGAFFKSTDGGRSWSKYGTMPQNCYYVTHCDFINANTGMAIASVGVLKGNTTADIIKTTDGGLTWKRLLNNNAAIDLKSISFVNDNIAFATGYQYTDTIVYGLVMKTTNGGNNWTTIINDTNRYNKVFFVNSSTGFIAGNNYSAGIIWKTTNQGNSWEIICSKDSLLIEGINFSGETGTGIAYGEKYYTGDNYQPFALRTSNFGETWNTQIIQDNYPTISLTASAILDKYNYFLVGGTFQEARIYNTKNGGSTSINNNLAAISNGFALNQNYPNPFNPITFIKYTVQSKSGVTLKVYDSMGKEITELVNEIQQQGTYEVKFDASNLSSGIYYYKFTADNFSETKKMILIK